MEIFDFNAASDSRNFSRRFGTDVEQSPSGQHPATPKAALNHRGSDINLSSVDLNLLVALEALLERCNVTHAANAVGLSQPAMSRALSRLRGMFNDDLLVRTSAGYVRTIRGEQLHDRLPQTLDAVRELVASRAMGAEEWQSALHIAMPDHQALVLLTQMWDRLNNDTVNTEIVVEPIMSNLLKRLENGELEMAIGQVSGGSTGFFQRTLYKDSYACLIRRDHPLSNEVLTTERYYDLRHAVIAPVHDVERDFVTDVLANVPSKNRCVLSQNTIGMAMAVAESDMVLTVPRRVATKLATLLPLQLVDLPVAADPYEVVLLWHERTHKSTEQSWMRSRIAEVAQGIQGGEAKGLEG